LKRPRYGIQSTTPKPGATPTQPPRPQTRELEPSRTSPPEPSVHSKDTSIYSPRIAAQETNGRHLIISEDEDESIANIFVFGAFADKNSGIVYHDLTGSFPFMSLDGSVCFFVSISSYKKLMNDPATAEVWQTAFGKDFGGMAQGDKKTGQKGTNAMFVMTHDELAHVLRAGKKITYANPVVGYRPQKDQPSRIRITAMGNLVSYDRE